MPDSLDRLLGLPVPDALRLLARDGIADVRVVPTAAPPRPSDPPRDDPSAADTPFQSTRVLAVRDGGRTLVVARFLTGDPRERKEGEPVCEA